MTRVLLIEDDITFSGILKSFLSRKGFLVEVAHTLQAARELYRPEGFDLLLLDYRLPDGIGLELITRDDKIHPDIPTIVITSFNDVRTAVKLMQSGIFEYIIKPVNPDELLLVINQALTAREEPVETRETAIPPTFIKGASSLSLRLYEYVDLVAPTDMSVLIVGESGTGKEHIARAIHDASKRKNEPFVAVDCGVLSKELAASELFGHVKGAFTGAVSDKKGYFEIADGGTVFLDEIGNLTYDVQVKLLRMLQERTIQPVGSNKTIHINVRLITATNEDLVSASANGNFRADIYHRINEFKIEMPPLRERKEDLDLFIAYFLDVANDELERHVKTVSDEVRTIFHTYDWPGNLRELKNVIKRMVLLTKDSIATADSLPKEMQELLHAPVQLRKNPEDLKAVQAASEAELIRQVLEKTRYNKSKAALLLNIDRKTLYAKMQRYGIE